MQKYEIHIENGLKRVKSFTNSPDCCFATHRTHNVHAKNNELINDSIIDDVRITNTNTLYYSTIVSTLSHFRPFNLCCLYVSERRENACEKCFHFVLHTC